MSINPLDNFIRTAGPFFGATEEACLASAYGAYLRTATRPMRSYDFRERREQAGYRCDVWTDRENGGWKLQLSLPTPLRAA